MDPTEKPIASRTAVDGVDRREPTPTVDYDFAPNEARSNPATTL
jgi:hypothetical protein